MLTPVVLGEVALSAVLAHAGNEHLIILALIPTREKSKRRAPGSRDPALAWNTTARTSPVRTLGSRSGSLPGCVYAWLSLSHKRRAFGRGLPVFGIMVHAAELPLPAAGSAVSDACGYARVAA